MRRLVRSSLGIVAGCAVLAPLPGLVWAQPAAPPPGGSSQESGSVAGGTTTRGHAPSDPPAPVEEARAESDVEMDDEVYEAVAEVEAPPRQATSRTLEARELSRVPGTSISCSRTS